MGVRVSLLSYCSINHFPRGVNKLLPSCLLYSREEKSEKYSNVKNKLVKHSRIALKINETFLTLIFLLPEYFAAFILLDNHLENV